MWAKFSGWFLDARDGFTTGFELSSSCIRELFDSWSIFGVCDCDECHIGHAKENTLFIRITKQICAIWYIKHQKPTHVHILHGPPETKSHIIDSVLWCQHGGFVCGSIWLDPPSIIARGCQYPFRGRSFFISVPKWGINERNWLTVHYVSPPSPAKMWKRRTKGHIFDIQALIQARY